jgi:L-seryl-tRNA(Ser) seleniumtransferase
VPGSDLPTTLLCVSGVDPVALAARLRGGPNPVIARIERDQVLLDPRTVLPGQDELVVTALRRALSQ